MGQMGTSATATRTVVRGWWSRDAVCASMVNQWALHPHLQQHLELLYQSDLFFEPFDIQFLTSAEVGTGGFGNMLHTMDVRHPDEMNRVDVTSDQNNDEDENYVREADDRWAELLSCRGGGDGGGRCSESQQFCLPPTDDVSVIPRRTIRAHRRRSAENDKDAATLNRVEDVATQLSSRVTLMSRPRASMGGVCDFFVSCGQVLMQLQYDSC